MARLPGILKRFLMGVVFSSFPHCCNNVVASPPGYVGPRNLPSTGFFPFLQTLMCNTDSNCHNKSRLVDPTASKSQRSSRYPLSLVQLVYYLLADLYCRDTKCMLIEVLISVSTTALILLHVTSTC